MNIAPKKLFNESLRCNETLETSEDSSLMPPPSAGFTKKYIKEKAKSRKRCLEDRTNTESLSGRIKWIVKSINKTRIEDTTTQTAPAAKKARKQCPPTPKRSTARKPRFVEDPNASKRKKTEAAELLKKTFLAELESDATASEQTLKTLLKMYDLEHGYYSPNLAIDGMLSDILAHPKFASEKYSTHRAIIKKEATERFKNAPGIPDKLYLRRQHFHLFALIKN